MGFNNGFEHVRLENKWKKLRIQYREAGMSEEAIQEMYNFDVQVVNSEQRYYRHSKDLAFNDADTEDTHSNDRYEEAILMADTYRETKSRFTWIGEIEDERLLSALEKLKEEDTRSTSRSTSTLLRTSRGSDTSACKTVGHRTSIFKNNETARIGGCRPCACKIRLLTDFFRSLQEIKKKSTILQTKYSAFLVENTGIEPVTSCMPCKRSPS